MTFRQMGEGALPAARMNKSIGWKTPLFFLSMLAIFALWESTPPAFTSQLSAHQIQSLVGGPSSTNTSSSERAPGDVGSVDNDSETGAENGHPAMQPKNGPVETNKSHANGVHVVTDSGPTTNLINANSTNVNSTEISEAATELMVNATSEGFVEDDTQLVDVSTIQDTPQNHVAEEKKYIVPLLTSSVGTGNQLKEYKSAAVIARTINRTLCLIPFFGGPEKHFGLLGDSYSGLVMEDRYDIDVLSKFVKVASIEECMQQCHWKLNAHWQLKRVKATAEWKRWKQWKQWEQWFNDTPSLTVNFASKYGHWNYTANLAKAMGPRNKAHCVGLGGLFPGLHWRGVQIAASTYLEPSAKVKKAVDRLRARALPGSNDYMAVHWRFEESKCRQNPIGLCFPRRADGAVIANGRRSETWETMPRDDTRGHYPTAGKNGVLVAKEDISGAIYDRAVKLGMQNIYLSTDGWLREMPSSDILKWVVEDIRSKGLNVAGLWMVGDLPNFPDGFYVEPNNMAELFGLDRDPVVSNHIIALVEQEVCSRAAVFVGSGLSTWSAAVANTRRGRRCKKELSDGISGLDLETPPEVMEQAIIDKMLTIQSVAGPICKGGGSNVTMEKYEDEIPDGWLDYDACEPRLLKGVGHCMRLQLSRK